MKGDSTDLTDMGDVVCQYSPFSKLASANVLRNIAAHLCKGKVQNKKIKSNETCFIFFVFFWGGVQPN